MEWLTNDLERGLIDQLALLGEADGRDNIMWGAEPIGLNDLKKLSNMARGIFPEKEEVSKSGREHERRSL